MGSIESTPEPGAQAGPRSLVFRVGGDVLACDIEFVREIVRSGHITRIPGAPTFVRGLVNVRGETLTVLDVGARLHAGQPPAERGSIIVADVRGRQVGLIVEEVIGVQAVAPQEGGQPAGDDASGIVRRMGHIDGRIVLYLDVPAFVSQSLA